MKNLILTLFFAAFAQFVSAQVSVINQDSLSVKAKDLILHTESKIFSDARTPRFVMTDRSQKFLFGVGGYVAVNGFYDFNGFGMDGLYVDQLPVPYVSSLPDKMGLSVLSSSLIFKMLGDTNLGIIETTFETGFSSEDNSMKLNKGYIRLGGFVVGLDWSVASDVLTFPSIIDSADPTGKVGYKMPIVRYAFNLSDKFRLYTSFEFPSLNYDYKGFEMVLAETRPDLNTKIVYRSKNGNYTGQFVTILRNLKADFTIDPEIVSDKFCYGFATYQRLKFGSNSIYFSGQTGLGVADYIAGLTSHNMNMISQPADNEYSMSLLPVWNLSVVGGYTHHWSQRSYSNLVASYTKILENNILDIADIEPLTIDNLFSLTANYLTEPISNLVVGGEFLFGRKEVFSEQESYGFRVGLLFRYNF